MRARADNLLWGEKKKAIRIVVLGENSFENQSMNTENMISQIITNKTYSVRTYNITLRRIQVIIVVIEKQ